MIFVLLAVVCCYFLAALTVYAIRRMSFTRKRSGRHYFLLAGNEQHHLEWVIRSIRRYASRTGTEVTVTVIDCGSADETMSIAACLAKRDDSIRLSKRTAGEAQELWQGIQAVAGEEDGEAVLLDLRNPDRFWKLKL
ncbi:hypothetical protein BG53_10000 [Paenibacillus darwinianus]|uniref:Uncharacterized protein n=1 Tax=Paenibacillus darwinianus TaxID=1380763 RepID=A0A9W5RYF5_9BACL|nr:hypothetical protein [Paenibacillus darwinianus]EXX84597.1 hypothetical protein CH50_11420 [Paenibacillus darwinianus]EXX84950.1 hypothetical protein BG53_10000 [Paenibacillus darwinianus]EXX86790.1 hypothetical protein BG52_05795 [Paenibacillus darwinianus]